MDVAIIADGGDDSGLYYVLCGSVVEVGRRSTVMRVGRSRKSWCWEGC